MPAKRKDHPTAPRADVKQLLRDKRAVREALDRLTDSGSELAQLMYRGAKRIRDITYSYDVLSRMKQCLLDSDDAELRSAAARIPLPPLADVVRRCIAILQPFEDAAVLYFDNPAHGHKRAPLFRDGTIIGETFIPVRPASGLATDLCSGWDFARYAEYAVESGEGAKLAFDCLSFAEANYKDALAERGRKSHLGSTQPRETRKKKLGKKLRAALDRWRLSHPHGSVKMWMRSPGAPVKARKMKYGTLRKLVRKKMGR